MTDLLQAITGLLLGAAVILNAMTLGRHRRHALRLEARVEALEALALHAIKAGDFTVRETLTPRETPGQAVNCGQA